ncbi:MAG: PilZ domain-containing protein [Chloroflexi bacterium]|nr:PilZ domain-containing protein [Chloroflexota bacterium]
MNRARSTNSLVTITWMRDGTAASARGRLTATAETSVALALEDPAAWFPEECVYLVTSNGDHDIVTVAQFSRQHERTAVFEVLAPWRRYNRRRDRRYFASLKAQSRAPGATEWSPGRVVNVSMHGMRMQLATRPATPVVEVALRALNNAAVMQCDVMGVHEDARGIEARLRFRELDAQSLVALHGVLTTLHSLEEQRPGLVGVA